ncbi:hypothetical protein DRW03_25500 [Corallococcus sp. H22C18031201]|uniref:isoprenylcysteine carboxyl methyltransferase family protein n=1 Tax=Citreicoccus inhibens TaxID=2849499 RepID=UPI000E7238F7|nr:isoprenylcysteine carboxylmethyltransferase family protein [Citreicoccus inhibens]MBU8898944.1 hypothetical protein [Citreicoccus inhibens]RJS18476.1 hypothetical protein DRW03_25500 [Corallococcus sp. H22C18031201]
MVTTTTWLYLGFLLLVVAERVVELVLSKRNAARAFARGGVEAGQGHYPVMVAFHTSFLVACAAEAVLWARPTLGWVSGVALAGAVAGQALRYWAISTLGDRWNSRIIVVPDLPPVTGGPYRYLRHPNYVAVVMEFWCLPMIHGAWVTALVFSMGNLLLLFVRIRAEEQALGAVYAREFSQRPRFIPEVRRG